MDILQAMHYTSSGNFDCPPKEQAFQKKKKQMSRSEREKEK